MSATVQTTSANLQTTAAPDLFLGTFAQLAQESNLSGAFLVVVACASIALAGAVAGAQSLFSAPNSKDSDKTMGGAKKLFHQRGGAGNLVSVASAEASTGADAASAGGGGVWGTVKSVFTVVFSILAFLLVVGFLLYLNWKGGGWDLGSTGLLNSNIAVSIQRFFSADKGVPGGSVLGASMSVDETVPPALGSQSDSSTKKSQLEAELKARAESNNVPEIKYRRQVFNVPGNKYDFNDAKAICTAYGARLATFDEVEDAYMTGGEWCNYGWSEGQMALFPTQKSTYKKLQDVEGHEHDCGRPGVNGGYFANPSLKFGVNCFGYKPKITSDEEEMMQHSSVFPKSMKDKMLEAKVLYWKQHLNDILVSPFNNTTWSKLL